MKVYDDIEAMLCKELENLTRKGELTANGLEVMYKAIDIIKDIKTVDAMDRLGGHYSETYPAYMEDGASYAMYRGSYDGGSYDGRGRINAPRDSMGRYSNDGYHGEDVMQKLHNMMNQSQNEQEKQVIRKLMDQLR